MFKKFTSLCTLCLIGVLTLTPITAFAVEADPEAEAEIEDDLKQLDDNQKAFNEYIEQEYARLAAEENAKKSNSTSGSTTPTVGTSNTGNTDASTGNTNENTDANASETAAQYNLIVRPRKIQPIVQQSNLSISCTITKLIGYDPNEPEKETQTELISSEYLHASNNYENVFLLEANQYYQITLGSYMNNQHFFDAYSPNQIVYMNSEQVFDFIYGDEDFLKENQSVYTNKSAEDDAKLIKNRNEKAADVENAAKEIAEEKEPSSYEQIVKFIAFGVIGIGLLVIVIYLIHRKRGNDLG